jgi:dTDP-4-dehydrorhamnose reductase
MIYLLGSTGYLGGVFKERFEARNIPYRCIDRKDLDYYNYNKLLIELGNIKTASLGNEPEFLINCAGYTGKPNVDACELNKDECLRANAVLPGVLARVCRDLNIPWGHVSSGCIYTSSGGLWKSNGWTEDDKPNFTFRSRGGCSWYSGTKGLGEEVLADYDNVYIWRMRIPFSNVDNSRNYLTKLMRYEKLLDVTNSLSDINEYVDGCIDSYLNKIPFGIYNMTNPGKVTTREVVALLKKYNISNKEFTYYKNESEFMQLAAKTPRSNCVLDSSKALNAGIKLTEVHEALERALANWKQT